MKPNVPCIIGPQIFPEVYEVFREEAQKKNAPLYCAGHDWFIERDQNGQNILFLNKAAGWPITEQSYLLPPQLPLIGQHQFGNAALALIASKIILQQKQQCDIGIDQIAPHLQQVQWPARLQDLSSHSYASLLPKGYKLWLDGGHNDSAGLALKAELSAWKKKNKAPIHLVSGMIETKQADEFFAPLREIVDSISCVPITGHIKSYAAEKLVRIATQDNKLEGQAYANIEQALKALASRAHSRHNGDSDSAGLVLICGSLYLAGAALGANENAKNHPG